MQVEVAERVAEFLRRRDDVEFSSCRIVLREGIDVFGNGLEVMQFWMFYNFSDDFAETIDSGRDNGVQEILITADAVICDGHCVHWK